MIDVKDRVPTYPGRVILTPVAGKANTFDMVRADEPIEPGTPINKALFDSMISEIEAMRTQFNNTLFAISQRALLSDVGVGTEISLMENGILVPFIKIQNNYEGVTGSLLIRKHCVTKMPLMSSGDTKYENCRADLWLTNEYFGMLDAATQAVALEVSIEISVNYDGTLRSSYISRKAFLLSSEEYNVQSESAIAYEGDAITYFDNNLRRVATFDGSPTDYYTRTYSGRTLVTDSITTEGSLGNIENNTVVEAGIRPVLLLPNSYEVTVGVPSTENVMATAEVL